MTYAKWFKIFNKKQSFIKGFKQPRNWKDLLFYKSLKKTTTFFTTRINYLVNYTQSNAA